MFSLMTTLFFWDRKLVKLSLVQSAVLN